MNMIPGTIFIDAVVAVTTNSSSKKPVLLMDIDTEALSSLLGIDYSFHFIPNSSTRMILSQGYLVSSSEAKVHPFEMRKKSTLKNKNTDEHEEALDHLIHVALEDSEKTSSSSAVSASVVRNVRWFEIMKESMVTLFLKKFRLR